MEFSITPSAEKFIRRMIRFGGAGVEAGFRLSVSPGGCSGLAAEFSVEAEPVKGDATVTWQDIKLFLPVESRLLLQGITIDFSETPLSSGFVFHNPNATGCGTCGTSASPPGEASVSLASIPVRASH